MRSSRQVFVAILCVLLAWQQVAAVVNSGKATNAEEQIKSAPENADAKKSAPIEEKDSVAAGTEDKGNRREAQLTLDGSFGPQPDSYLPSSPSNLNLPVPVYGVPDAPSNNIVYPEPPPDIPPLVAPSLEYGLPQVSNSYGPPLVNSYLPPPKNIFGPPNIKYGPPKNFGPNRIKPFYGPPRFQYGPPGKPIFNTKFKKYNSGGYKYIKPSGIYGPPSGYFNDNYKPTGFKVNFDNINKIKHDSAFGFNSLANQGGLLSSNLPIQYGVPNKVLPPQVINVDFIGLSGNGISNQYVVPDIEHGSHSIAAQYGPPDVDIIGLKPQYGPPQPSPHPRPPHPGAPAPPTPPDIKYDGWQPIPGLVSRVPTTSYGLPPTEQHVIGDLSYNKDLIPPPPIETHVEHQAISGVHGSVASLALESSYVPPSIGLKDSYGAPLNTVTGSGGIVSASGSEAHSGHAENINFGASAVGVDPNIQTIKTVGHELFSGGTFSGSSHSSHQGGNDVIFSDSYSAPPLNSYSPDGPYAAAHSYNNIGSSNFGSSFSKNILGHSSFNSHQFNGQKGLSLSSSGIGLIPPSGIYGVPPSGQYGTPLFSGPSHSSGLNALKINPPKHPVIHREPVPPGIFDSITKQQFHGHAHGGTNYVDSTYLPPPVPDFSRPTKEYGVPNPSNLFSLPKAHSAISFQNIQHGSSNGINLNLEGGSDLTSYNAPLKNIDTSYNLPIAPIQGNLNQDVIGLDLTHPGLTIDFTKGTSAHTLHDCNFKTQSQPLPALSYGLPTVNSYRASHVTGNTNFEGAYSGLSVPVPNYGVPSLPTPSALVSPPQEAYGIPDLTSAHSQKVHSELKTNLIESESHGKAYGKSVANSFGPSSELIQSQSIDFNNIPLQGALGSYTLQIQSADGKTNGVPHGQVLNDGLLQSILAAIEQPQKGDQQPILQFQQSLEQQNFVTNDTISSVVGQLADAEIRHSTQLAKDAIELSSEISDPVIQHSSPNEYIIAPTENEKQVAQESKVEEVKSKDDDKTLSFLEENGIALYFNKNAHLKKKSAKENTEKDTPGANR